MIARTRAYNYKFKKKKQINRSQSDNKLSANESKGAVKALI